ncbi:hypothetical protein EV122DRAFT_222351, partial [Schizophyllum commune]
ESVLKRASYLASIDLQRSGFVPSPQERMDLLGYSEELRFALSLSDPQRRLSLGLRQRAAAQLDIIHSIISPVRRLPPELLSIIFILLCSSSVDNGARLISETVHRVCFEWQVVARQTPQLWTYISDVPAERPRIQCPNYYRQAALTGDLPLRLKFTLRKGDEFYNQLYPHLDRWHTIHVTASGLLLENFQALTFPSMRAATFHIYGSATSRSLQFLTKAPALSSLSIRLMRFDADESILSSLLSLPAIPHLTSLGISISRSIGPRVPPPPMVKLLTAIRTFETSLVSLCVNTVTKFGGTELPANRCLQLSSLRKLRLLGTAVIELFRYIVAPELESLTISPRRVRWTRATDSNCSFSHMRDFLSFQPLHLRQLHIHGSAGMGDLWSFLHCLGLLDDLEELEVREPRESSPYFLTERTLAFLTCIGSGRDLLPKLSRLVVVTDDRTAVQSIDHALNRMLSSRATAQTCASEGVAALEHVEINVLDRLDNDDSDVD